MSTEPNKQPSTQPNKQAGAPKPPRSPGSWVAIACGMILLVVLLVFILQNSKEVKVSFFMVHWRAPLAVDLLFATVLGGLIVFAAGSVHIIQLRRLVRHHQAGAAGSGRHPGDSEESHHKD